MDAPAKTGTLREEIPMNNALKRGMAAALFTIAGMSVALAHGFTLGELKIGHPWAKPTITGAKVGGGFMKITNEGKTDDRLVSVTVVPEIAGTVQLHEMKMENDVMKMREVEGGIAVPAGQTVELKPGGLHVMFMEIPKPLVDGDKFKATLKFEKAGTVDVEFMVQKPKEGDMGNMNMGNGNMGNMSGHDHSEHKP